MNEELNQELEMIADAERHLNRGDNPDYWQGVIAGLKWHTFGEDIDGIND